MNELCHNLWKTFPGWLCRYKKAIENNDEIFILNVRKSIKSIKGPHVVRKKNQVEC